MKKTEKQEDICSLIQKNRNLKRTYITDEILDFCNKFISNTDTNIFFDPLSKIMILDSNKKLPLKFKEALNPILLEIIKNKNIGVVSSLLFKHDSENYTINRNEVYTTEELINFLKYSYPIYIYSIELCDKNLFRIRYAKKKDEFQDNQYLNILVHDVFNNMYSEYMGLYYSYYNYVTEINWSFNIPFFKLKIILENNIYHYKKIDLFNNQEIENLFTVINFNERVHACNLPIFRYNNTQKSMLSYSIDYELFIQLIKNIKSNVYIYKLFIYDNKIYLNGFCDSPKFNQFIIDENELKMKFENFKSNKNTIETNQ